MRQPGPAAAPSSTRPVGPGTILRVMSFNIWGGGANEGRGIGATVAAIRAAAADIVGLQETRAEPGTNSAGDGAATGDSVAPALAAALGWHHHDQTRQAPGLWANAVLSRHPIVRASPNDLGVQIDVAGRSVWLFNIHHDDAPYQPFQLLGIDYGPAPVLASAADAIRAAADARGPAMDLLAADIAAAGAADAVFVTGDFNEPSGLDWTAAAVSAGRHPVAVDWPAARRLRGAGFVDAYRAVHPDPVAKPAFTWTPRRDEAAPDDHPDRIDFVYARGPGLVVTAAAIVGEAGPRSDIAVMPWPSDHRGVVAEVRFQPPDDLL